MAAINFESAVVGVSIAWACCMVAALLTARAIGALRNTMGKQKPMSGAKLSLRVVDRLRQLGDMCDVEAEARKYQIHPKTVQRILDYETWVEPKLAGLLDEENKQCVWCGAVFNRRYPSGRWRNDAQWAAKRTCNPSCNMYLMWKDGVFNSRRR